MIEDPLFCDEGQIKKIVFVVYHKSKRLHM